MRVRFRSSIKLSSSAPLVRTAIIVGFMGCAAPIHRHPVPQELLDAVHVAGMPAGIRDWGDRPSAVLQRSAVEMFAQAMAAYGTHPPRDVLAISGGGANGAYAAGLLCGWTAAGNRPTFRAVTGVSVGAIIAPLAFLGPAYDDQLEAMVRTVNDNVVFRRRGLLSALSGDSLADNAPLSHYVGQFFDEPLLRAVAAEHAKGRRLFIATTNLDSKRPVIWDMGAIASSGSPRALFLFREVIVASAAVPVAFPPTYVRVESAGSHYDEMHVDGGVTEQILLYGSWLSLADLPKERPEPLTFYIIRNGKLAAQWDPVAPKIAAIANDSIGTLTQAQAIGDIWRAYVICQRDGQMFRLASIPEDVVIPPTAGFDPHTTVVLFERGYALARAGYRWADHPPGLMQPSTRPSVAPATTSPSLVTPP